MKQYLDEAGRIVTFTDAAAAEIPKKHREMTGLLDQIPVVLASPDARRPSRWDPRSRLFYRFYPNVWEGDKYICVAVKYLPGEAYVVTAYVVNEVPDIP
ncbi:MAG: hypothetical protein FJ319_08805 [SAR202 cluster bacterium]|nr:hypothetical protein [SAR202 cluster bacterium]